MSARLGPAGRLRLPEHRESSATLAGVYPFWAPPPPQAGVPIGIDRLTGTGFAFDPWTLYQQGALTNPNVLLAGVIGQGKSALAKSLAIRSIAAGRQVHVPGDPKGEWAPVARLVGGQVLRLGPGLPDRLNPLAHTPGADPQAARAGRVGLLAALAEATAARALAPVEHTLLDLALAETDTAPGEPTLPRLLDRLGDPSPATLRDAGLTRAEHTAAARDARHALRRATTGDLAGMFDAPTTARVDPASPMVVLDLSALGADTAITIAMTCAASWLHTTSQPGAKRWVIYDEAWRLLGSLPLLRRLQAQWKLSRAHGTANLLVLHRLSDLDATGPAGSHTRALASGLLADCSTRIIYRQETDQSGPTSAALGLTAPERALLPALPRGVGLWKLPRASHLVTHLLHPAEAPVIDTDHAMRDQPTR